MTKSTKQIQRNSDADSKFRLESYRSEIFELIDIATVKTKRLKGHGITIVVKLLGTIGYDTRSNFDRIQEKYFYLSYKCDYSEPWVAK